LTFEAAEGGKTKMTNHMLFASREDRDGMLSSGMEEGGIETLDRLDALLKQLQATRR
jgi:uncharacterized protein YndB with AHSA1/START domain